MNTNKQNYLERIRTQSSYPTFRSVIGMTVILLYVMAALTLLGGILIGLYALAEGQPAGLLIAFVAFVPSLLLVIIGRVIKEVSLMLADIADSITDLNSRYEQHVSSDQSEQTAISG